MPTSKAFEDFKESLSIAEELLKIEKGYSNPPRRHEQKAVQGLRGAVAVLVVASFEQFLKEVMEEYLTKLTMPPVKPLNALPDDARVCSIFNTLERAMKGPPFQKAPAKKDRIPDIDVACRKILSDVINPVAFIDTAGNPNADRIKTLLKNLGLNDVFTGMQLRFESKWRKPVAHTFIADKLNEIVNRRHVVAHTAYALAITRGQLRESVRFLKIVAELVDFTIKKKIMSW
jgi:HEPN superfamily RiboL-PSP-like protein